MLISPWIFILGTFSNPLSKQFSLCLADLFMRFGRWHDLVRIGVKNACHEFRFLGLPWLDRPAFGSSLKSVEAQILLAGLGIRSVTMEALIRKDGPDVAVEIDFFLGRKHGHDGE